MDNLQRLYENAKRKTESFHNWWNAKRKQWTEERLDNLEKAEDKSEVKSAEFQGRMEQYKNSKRRIMRPR